MNTNAIDENSQSEFFPVFFGDDTFFLHSANPHRVVHRKVNLVRHEMLQHSERRVSRGRGGGGDLSSRIEPREEDCDVFITGKVKPGVLRGRKRGVLRLEVWGY